MLRRNKTLVLVAILTVFLTVIISLLVRFPISQGQVQKTGEKIGADFPIASFSQVELATDTENRKTKNAYFDQAGFKKIQENAEVQMTTQAESWIELLPAIPVKKSDIIITGTVKDTGAYLSKNKSSVYSEFHLIVEKIIFAKDKLTIPVNEMVSAVREGGSVRFPSGHIQIYRLSGEGSLKEGNNYVLFLKRDNKLKDFLLLTAYRIENEKIYPVDDLSNSSELGGKSFTEFLEEINNTISRFSKEESPL